MSAVWDAAFPYIAALLPTVAVGTLFYFIVKNILEGDRNERLAQSKWEARSERDVPERDDPVDSAERDSR